jgi:signal transduction histidine kinase
MRVRRSETVDTPARKVIEDAIAYCVDEVEAHGVVLEARIARDLPRVAVDPLQIGQVIVNLVRNAAEALSDAGRIDGRIVIEAATDAAGFVIVRVRDNGPGFDADVLDRATAPFTTTKPGGIGLGLSLAKSLIEAHNGHLRIESGARGSSVSFTLPSSR